MCHTRIPSGLDNYSKNFTKMQKDRCTFKVLGGSSRRGYLSKKHGNDVTSAKEGDVAK